MLLKIIDIFIACIVLPHILDIYLLNHSSVGFLDLINNIGMIVFVGENLFFPVSKIPSPTWLRVQIFLKALKHTAKLFQKGSAN